MRDTDFEIIEPPDHVWRVARGENPLALRPWNTVSDEAPLAGRFDDDRHTFRTLYTSTAKAAALREVLRDFRPSSKLLEALRNIDSGAGDQDPSSGFGDIPVSWLATRCIGKLRIQHPSPCVDIAHSRSLAALFVRTHRSISAGDVLGPDRQLTRSLARFFWNDDAGLMGIRYPSIEGIDNLNFAFFETARNSGLLRAHLVAVETIPVRADDPDLFDVAQAFRLRIPGLDETHRVSYLLTGFRRTIAC